MRKILPLIGIFVFLLSCNRVERIQSLSQLEPALCKHVGYPSKIDTVYKNEYSKNGSILYQYDDSLKVSFEQLTNFISKAYDYVPELTIESKRQVANFTSKAFKVAVLEYYGSKDNKRHLNLIVSDINNELIIPSSQTPQTVAPSK